MTCRSVICQVINFGRRPPASSALLTPTPNKFFHHRGTEDPETKEDKTTPCSPCLCGEFVRIFASRLSRHPLFRQITNYRKLEHLVVVRLHHQQHPQKEPGHADEPSQRKHQHSHEWN